MPGPQKSAIPTAFMGGARAGPPDPTWDRWRNIATEEVWTGLAPGGSAGHGADRTITTVFIRPPRATKAGVIAWLPVSAFAGSWRSA